MSGGSPSSTTTQQPTSSAYDQLVSGTVPQIQAAQALNPIYNYTQPQVQQTAGLSPTQQYVSGLVPQIAQTSPYTTQAAGQINQLTGGAIGSSPLTQAGMQAFTDITQPSIQNTLATMGLGRSGAGANVLAQAQTAAAVPFLTQEIANRESAIPQLANLAAQQTGQLATAGTLGQSVGGTEQTTAQNSLNAIYNDYLRRQQLAQETSLPSGGFSLQPLSTTTQQTSSGGGFLGK